MTFAITKHAIDRYIERIAPVTRDEARRAIGAGEAAAERAVAFGAHTVRLGNGAKLCLVGRDTIRVVTVLKRNWINAADRPRPMIAAATANRDDALSPSCCGGCGVQAGHPIARACIRTDCPLGHRHLESELAS